MRLGMRGTFNVALAVTLSAGLCACQTTETKTQVQATAPVSGMDSDIRRILVAGGIDPSAPGSLRTTKMPPEVQQAVAALQGAPAPAVPNPAPASAIAALQGDPVPTTVAASPAVPPMIAAVNSVSKRGRRGASQFALAPAPAAQMPPAVAAAASGGAAIPSAALAYAPQQGQMAGLPVQNAAQQAPIPSAATLGQAVAQVAAQQPQHLSQVQSYLPPAPPSMRTVVLTGPNADRRAASAAINGGGVAIPSQRATQAAVRVMASTSPTRAEPTVTASTPAPAPVPEEPRIRRF